MGGGILRELLQGSQHQMLGKAWGSVLAALALSSGPGCRVGDVIVGKFSPEPAGSLYWNLYIHLSQLWRV